MKLALLVHDFFLLYQMCFVENATEIAEGVLSVLCDMFWMSQYIEKLVESEVDSGR